MNIQGPSSYPLLCGAESPLYQASTDEFMQSKILCISDKYVAEKFIEITSVTSQSTTRWQSQNNNNQPRVAYPERIPPPDSTYDNQ